MPGAGAHVPAAAVVDRVTAARVYPIGRATTQPPPRVVRPKRAWIERKSDGMLLVDEASEALFRDVMGDDHSGT